MPTNKIIALSAFRQKERTAPSGFSLRQPWLCRMFLHNYTPWETVADNGLTFSKTVVQRCFCAHCGKIKLRKTYA